MFVSGTIGWSFAGRVDFFSHGFGYELKKQDVAVRNLPLSVALDLLIESYNIIF